jgi:ADP-heptose:LPS heptosyltransferase
MVKGNSGHETAPQNILMIKAHSAGIGDILRSSAAWRALKNRFPEAKLHLLLLTKEPGYASENFIARHHLLSSFRSLDKRTQGLAGWRKMLSLAGEFAAACKPDLIIDFEPHGLRTSILSRWLSQKQRAASIGVGQVPMRGLFYGRSSVSTKRFARQRNLATPLEYTDRDFAALSALGIERCGAAIELAETEEGKKFRSEFRRRFNLPESARLVGLNIGCGTPGAEGRRPSLAVLSRLAAHLQTAHGLVLVVGLGGRFEAEVDREFLRLHQQQCSAPVIDLGGKTSLFELGGLIKACTLFVSGDTGPYHIAVALRTPTLAVFNLDFPEAYHHHPWVRCICAPSLEDVPRLIEAAEELLRVKPDPED